MKLQKDLLAFIIFSLFLTIFANFPFGYYQKLNVPAGVVPDTVYGLNIFGVYIINATTIFFVSDIIGAWILNFALLYSVYYFLFKKRGKKK